MSVWHRLLDVDLVLPYYHAVSDVELPHISGIYKFRNLRQFKMDVEFLLRHYVPVGLQDVIAHLDGIRPLPEHCFLLTFDDGFREVYDVIAPVLYSKGVPAVFFLATSVIDNRALLYPQKKSLVVDAMVSAHDRYDKGQLVQCLANGGVAEVAGGDLLARVRRITYSRRYVLDELAPLVGCDFASYSATREPHLTSAQVNSLIKMGFTIGAHSVDHPLYTELSLEEQLRQTKESVNWLSAAYGCKCESFAFPFNDDGVSIDFFRKCFEDGEIKISFGTGGMNRHSFPRNLERFTMEKTDVPAVQILARQFGKTLFRRP